ncbi:hypothetical protein [Pseudotamlana agarivorans]|uniref:hypothetical protein n=1 Tax=Pseudotamlana agarivorans TaxID=481183 RepID=UPI00082E8360|nr:hypothetical protein [Tamlana agarivorans]
MKHYLPNELDFKDGSEKEQIRTRKIFEDLKQKAIDGKKLLEREKRFLCTGLKLTLKQSDGRPENFGFCDDFIFRELYLTYFHNNLEGPFYKAKKGKIVEVTQKEQVQDFKKLQIFSNKWQREIEKTNHKDQILQEVATETRKDLKELDKKYPRLVRKFRRQQDRYRLQKDKIIMQSKFIYHLTKSVIEDYEKSEFEIPFSGQTVELTIYSFVHIMSRHYSEHIKDKPEKTYHYDHFYPKELHLDLRNILTEIDKLNRIDISKTDNIIFEYKGVVYQLWIQKRTKQLKGKGNVSFNRIQSFYPIYNEEKINEIRTDYETVELYENLKVFIEK